MIKEEGRRAPDDWRERFNRALSEENATPACNKLRDLGCDMEFIEECLYDYTDPAARSDSETLKSTILRERPRMKKIQEEARQFSLLLQSLPAWVDSCVFPDHQGVRQQVVRDLNVFECHLADLNTLEVDENGALHRSKQLYDASQHIEQRTGKPRDPDLLRLLNAAERAHGQPEFTHLDTMKHRIRRFAKERAKAQR